MINYGFSITKQGKNVLTETDPLSYVFTSKFNTLKIWKVVEMSISVPNGGTGHVYYTHGFGYKPAYLAYYKLSPTAATWFCDRTSVNNGISDNDGYRASTTTTVDTLDFSVQDAFSVGARTCAVKCFIFVDPIQNIPMSNNGIGKTVDYGVKVSQPNIDVTKAKTHELFISSKYPGLKFHMDKTVRFTITAGNVAGETQFEHGLGYVPAAVGMVEDFNDTTLHDSIPFGRVPQPQAEAIRMSSGSVYVSAVQEIFPGDVTYTMKVIVFKDKIAAA